ncbi:MAG: hypothetical protein J6U05_07725 [Neisseriaceae bacterium]|nr:hypothetical protein [Neisseriaceae bacterium]
MLFAIICVPVKNLGGILTEKWFSGCLKWFCSLRHNNNNQTYGLTAWARMPTLRR